MKVHILFPLLVGVATGQVTALAPRASVIHFTQAIVTVDESTPQVVLEVRRSGDLDAAVTVDYSTADGTARAGEDFEAAAGTIGFAAGESYGRIIVPLVNDGLHGTAEAFQVALSNPTGGLILGKPALVTVTIQDNDPGVALYGDWAWEDAGTLVVPVWRGNDGDFPFTVDYATSDDTAHAGLDYQPVTGTLSFATGEANQTIAIPILNDGLRETNETFRLTLRNPTGGWAVLDRGGVASAHTPGGDCLRRRHLPGSLPLR